jgi:hypothetical protein
MKSTAVNGGYLTFSNGSTVPLYIGFGSTLATGLSTSDAALRYSNNLVFSAGAAEVGRFNSNGTLIVSTAGAGFQKNGSVTSLTVATGDGYGLSTSYGLLALDSGATGLAIRMYNGGYYTPFIFGKNGVMGVGGATPTASGAGIQFPATQQASSDANVLDDYEEGIWFPNQGSGLSFTGTFTSSGIYTKIGNLVTVNFRVSGTNISCSSTGEITSNLPFSIAASPGNAMGSCMNSNNANTGAYGYLTTVTAGTTALSASGAIFVTITYQV